jgi:hypothetical protein
MNTISKLLQQPEYVHVAINHFPLIGLLIGMLSLVAALIVRSRAATLIGLALVALTALSVWPVSYYGEAGYDRVLSMADDPGQAFLKHHMELADHWGFLYYVAAVVAALAFGLSWKWPRVLLPGSILSLVLAVASLIAGIAIAQAGGEVRHREFRFRPPPAENSR